jgi:hypothetical protein
MLMMITEFFLIVLRRCCITFYIDALGEAQVSARTDGGDDAGAEDGHGSAGG